jgi:trehalose 6-phosphate phosphatase
MATLKPLWLSLGMISERLNQSNLLNIATDFDGTLTPIQPHPEDAHLSTRAREALAALVGNDGVNVAVLSGRSLDDLEQRIGIGSLFLAGLAGIETRDPEGQRKVQLGYGEGLSDELKAEMTEWCRRFEGSWLEDKRYSFTLHYRATPEHLQPAFCAGVRRRMRVQNGSVQVIHGKKAFEVIPRAGWTKEVTLRHWLPALDEGVLFYFGDDTHDEPVHEAVRLAGGISVAVGRTASRAEYGVASSDDVVWFLEWLGRQWQYRVPTMEPKSSTTAES